MNPRIQKTVIEMVTKYAVEGRTDISPVPYLPQKTAPTPVSEDVHPLPRTTPESVGISSRYIRRMVDELAADPAANIHNIIVACRGKIIFEASAPGYSTSVRCLTHSMAKSITALAAGTLIDRGVLSLSTRVCDALRSYCPSGIHPAVSQLTLLDLLSMSSGINDINEAATVADEHWLTTFLSATPESEPGTVFKYNSINSYVISAMITAVTGKPLSDIIREKLLEPMGIRDFFSEKSPEGFDKGGWGMYLSPHSMAKIGHMFISGGIYRGRRIVSENWLKLMSQTSFVTEASKGDYNYGLHAWVSRDRAAVTFNGMLGQNIWTCPPNGIVVVLTAGNESFFQKYSALEIISKYLKRPFTPHSTPLKHDRAAYSDLLETERAFGRAGGFVTPLQPAAGIRRLLAKLLRRPLTPLPCELGQICGTYSVSRNNAGMLPLFVRFMQNNHSAGIDTLSMSAEGNSFYVTFKEGRESYRFEVGFYSAVTTSLCFHGEYYLISAMGQIFERDDGLPVLKLLLCFPELPNVRTVTVFPEAGGVHIDLREIPGRSMVDGLLNDLIPEPLRGGGLAAFIRTRMFGVDPLKCIGPATEPSLYAERKNR